MRKRLSILILFFVIFYILPVKVVASDIKTQWVKGDAGWWLKRDDNTYPKSKWELVEGKWYWFDDIGYMATGWKYINYNWYYLNADGSMAVNTNINGCDLGDDGVWFKNEIKNYPNLGFNVKGSLSVDEQTKYLRNELNRLQKSGIDTSKIWLRLQGGTISQKTYPSDWTDEMISLWADIQKDFGCKLIFVVNFNDTANGQIKFMNRMESKGMNFSAIELGNEQYLARYTEKYSGKFEEVTKRTANMTVNKYVKLSNEYIESMQGKNIPFYVQFAPDKEEAQKLKSWNTDMVNAVNENKFSSRNINGTLHLYEKNGPSSLDTYQIQSIRGKINGDFCIAVTEYGVLDKKYDLNEGEYIQYEKNLTDRLIKQMKSGDILLNQVLYTDYKEEGAAVLHPDYDGVTKKGESILGQFTSIWKQ
ncbi:hypothetical protein [Clostridium butyricum]|nr:hypothetical protein [Clostridium butyricum]